MTKKMTTLLALIASLSLPAAGVMAADPSHESHKSEHQHHHGDDGHADEHEHHHGDDGHADEHEHHHIDGNNAEDHHHYDEEESA